MSDNTVINPGSGGDTVRDIQRTTNGPKTQVVAIDIGGTSGNPEMILDNGQVPSFYAIPVVPASDWSDPSLQRMLLVKQQFLQLQDAQRLDGFVPYETPSIGA
jgi:hypothetical protein